MLTLGSGIKIWVAGSALDMRRSFDRLAEMVTQEWKNMKSSQVRELLPYYWKNNAP